MKEINIVLTDRLYSELCQELQGIIDICDTKAMTTESVRESSAYVRKSTRFDYMLSYIREHANKF